MTKKRQRTVIDGNLVENRKGTPHFAIPLWAAICLSVLIIALFAAIWSLNRHLDPHLHLRHGASMSVLLPSMTGVTHGSIENGNQVEVLQNGAFFDSLLRDLAGAKQSIHFETFLWRQGEICRRIALLLAEKARAGVEVRVTLDASGSHQMDKKLLTLMKSAGCKVQRYHPFTIGYIGRLNNRDHRKIVVIDGRIGYAGGHGVASMWTGNAQDKEHYRDTGVRVTGPIVSSLQSAFCENWIEETGELLAGPAYFPVQVPAGPTTAHLAYVSTTNNPSDVSILYFLAIESARQSITIQNPYFLPSNEVLDALRRAVKRGVLVRVMLPATDVTDNGIVGHAGHHHFGNLLKAGVHIYEYQRTLLHQKVMVIDHQWSTIGSTNFDDRSFELNDEISMGFLDRDIAMQLERAFDDDLRYTRERKLSEWKERGWWHKTIDGAAYLVNHQL